MSRIGKKPVPLPSGVTARVEGSVLTVKGAQGELTLKFHSAMKVTIDDKAKQIVVARPDDERQNRALHGLTRSLVNNMVSGVVKAFEKKLEIVGVGYQASVAGKNLSDWGHFMAINHETGDKLKATTLTTSFDADGFAVITGTAQVNGVGGHQFTVRVKDNGEPGRGHDQFELTSTAPGMNVPQTTLGGGNIQFHIPCKPNP